MNHYLEHTQCDVMNNKRTVSVVSCSDRKDNNVLLHFGSFTYLRAKFFACTDERLYAISL